MTEEIKFRGSPLTMWGSKKLINEVSVKKGRIYLPEALLIALGDPDRLIVFYDDKLIALRPTADELSGYRVNTKGSTHNITSREFLEKFKIIDERYPAFIEEGMIVFRYKTETP